EAYPKKADKADALKAWEELAPTEEIVEKILAGLAAWKNSKSWKEQAGRFVTRPAKFLLEALWQTPPEVETNERQKTAAFKSARFQGSTTPVETRGAGCSQEEAG